MKQFFFIAFTILGVVLLLGTCENKGNKVTYNPDKAAEYERNNRNRDGNKPLVDNAYPEGGTASNKETVKINPNASKEVKEVKTITPPPKPKYPSELVINIEELLFLLHQESDTVYVVNFWATWCKPCVKELPYFEELHANYKKEKLKVVLVSLDFPELVEQRLKPFLKKKNLQSKVHLLDAPTPNSWIDRVSEEWSGSIPATMIVAPHRNHRQFYEREFTYPALESTIKPLLSKSI